MLTNAEAHAVYHAMIKTGFALPGQDHIEKFVELQTSGFAVVCLIPSVFYPAQFFATERDGCRWQAGIFNADMEARKVVQETNQELRKVWSIFNPTKEK
jgi:hypothetical protein